MLIMIRLRVLEGVLKMGNKERRKLIKNLIAAEKISTQDELLRTAQSGRGGSDPSGPFHAICMRSTSLKSAMAMAVLIMHN